MYIFKNGYGAFMYAFEIRGKSSGSMAFESQIFCVLDSLPTIFLQGLLILVPYLWFIIFYFRLKNISIFM